MWMERMLLTVITSNCPLGAITLPAHHPAHYPAHSRRAACLARPSSSTHRSSSGGSACSSCPFSCGRPSCASLWWVGPPAIGGIRGHQQWTSVHPMRSDRSSCNIQCSHVNRCTNLSLKRGHDRLTLFMSLRWKSSKEEKKEGAARSEFQ